MNRVAPIFSDADIDDAGNGTSAELGCLECHATTVTRWVIAGPWLLAVSCQNCLFHLLEISA